MQGGLCALPIPQFPTGVMRGRFHPQDGQLYLCGMYAWAGSQTQPGGLYRLRYTGRPVHVPVGLSAEKGALVLEFSAPLDGRTATDVQRYALRRWALRRTANYGSNHLDERALRVAGARLSDDGRRLRLEVPDLAPTWCFELEYALQSPDGAKVEGVLDGTLHALPAPGGAGSN
jgi:hypothetical protein